MNGRIDRVQETLKREISSLLLLEARDDRIDKITITRVRVSRDIQNARVYYRYYGEAHSVEDVAKGLKKASSFIRSMLAERLSMKFTPHIAFYLDAEEEKKEHMDDIFRKIKEERTGYTHDG